MSFKKADPICGMSPLLERHRIFASQKADDLYAFLEGKNFLIEHKTRNNPSFDTRINGVYMPGMFLGYLQYGPAVSIRANGRNDFWLQMPTQGHMEVATGADRIVCNTTRAAIVSPTCQDYYNLNSAEGTGGIRVCLYRSSLMECLTHLIGDLPNKPLRFSPEINLETGHGRFLSQHILLAVRNFESQNGYSRNPAMMVALREFVLTTLLSAQQHSYSDQLKKLEIGIAPRDVKRAVDYIQAHSTEQITISAIVSAVGIPGRTLFKQFHDHIGSTPMQYLRDVRFERVRKSLLKADAQQTVTDIAMESGFLHMGRFASEYRRRYGEKPSETLRRPTNRL